MIDKEYESYVYCWEEYHKAASLIDGHIKVPKDEVDIKLIRQASIAGHKAMNWAAEKLGFRVSEVNKEKWQRAKEEALRRLNAR